MRLLLLVFLLSQAAVANAVIDCEAKAVFNSNIFEEGLSAYEYPSLTIKETSSGYVASIGVMHDYEPETDVVEPVGELKEWRKVFKIHRDKELTEHSTELKFFYSKFYEYDEEGEELEFTEGILMVKDAYETQGEWEPLARFTCN